MLPVQGAWVQSLVRELDPTCYMAPAKKKKKIEVTAAKERRKWTVLCHLG